MVYLYRKKQGAIPKCGDCKAVKLHGITPARPKELSRMSRRLKTVTRAYGGSRCHKCVRTRYVYYWVSVEIDRISVIATVYVGLVSFQSVRSI